MTDERAPASAEAGPAGRPQGESDKAFERSIHDRIDEVLRAKSGERPSESTGKNVDETTRAGERGSDRDRPVGDGQGPSPGKKGRLWWIAAIVLILLGLALILILGMTDRLGCGSRSLPAADIPVREDLDAPEAPPTALVAATYQDAREALGLSDSTYDSLSGTTAQSPSQKYLLQWIDASGAVQEDSCVVELRDNDRLEGGRAICAGATQGPLAEGAYKIARGDGGLGYDIAVWLPGPAAEPRLHVFRTRQSAGTTLTGPAEARIDGSWTKLDRQVRATKIE